VPRRSKLPAENTVERSPGAHIARCPAAIAAADNRDLGALPSVGG
jgi:hypothetical protein